MSENQYYYTTSHECFSLEGQTATVSITEYAVDQLGEITFVQLPEVGRELSKGESFGEIESVKTVSELYAPVSGKVVAINSELDAQPELVNDDSLKLGWMLKIELSQPDEVSQCMDQAAYQEYLDGLS
ncbi:glycine cleavage system protein H [bacterium (Candidatus Blackallbacteria) CG17_big_fil_post_rev_8_21_14_2_50_48_46]|uniref:Glycine cleavage system H protein n=1 Tax=bacterium (Candidatus Blackallbacteria) CG17_big_fil_post_rev_8_21_14_2_50_48_46 TaxID=2014261 RepID=A0A2M7FZQ4_9BACT|nr:MAG: glycine cleavage system protein H [bacterium (Candidatus Blackallbacteria) CG18_big_fil_WC_8_21_14_2_50_49_26]PIW14891.1 MAG: glycine cleavage system protein H [bacterium (Candidatus Blackallbacteria) CG17_big_fil_post_rev_8_21_14_2_50_48_46]PIW44321.1 MAG: glycine cleavage system protein H [bacterium (Candidatus Blackallbacteria) CG13_big_fil_rev_8_21_14_2_50_49_14]